MKNVSVVILNWNGKDLLERFLPSVVKFTNSDIADIIIVDNNSSDDSVSFLREKYPQLKIIELSDNYGFAEGYNIALSQINSKNFILLNSDVEVTENWLDPMLNFLEENLDVAAIQPKILSQQNKEYFEYAGASGGFIDKYGYPFCRGRIFNVIEKDNLQYETPLEIFWASGACMLIRSKDFLEVGGFDSTFFAHMEEIDLCWRLNARGRKIICIPQSVVYHVGGATLNQESPRKTFLNFRNNLLMLYKNLPKESLNRVLIIRFVLDYLAALQLLIQGKKENCKSILKAHTEFKKIKRDYLNKRIENIDKTTKQSKNAIFNKSILWSFYIMRRKKFNELANAKEINNK